MPETLEMDHKRFDYNCFIEDDIVIRDGDFFKKLRTFNKSFGNQYLLQPNREELSDNLRSVKRFYIDGDYNPKASEKYRNAMNKELSMVHLGEQINFKQPLNCHSGCFFLNSKQSEIYFNGEYWNREDNSFHSPLESAATLGVMQQFEIMKPAKSNLDFLTIEHDGKNFIGMVG